MLDLAVKLQMLQERYKSNAEQGYVSALKDAHERIVGKLASTDGTDQIKRLKAIRALIEDEIGQLYESVKPDLKDDMQGFAELEHKTLFNYMNETNGLGYAFVALPKDTIKEVLDFDAVIPMGDKGYSVNDFFDTASQAHINRYKQIIAGGLASNDGYRAITKRLKEADAKGTMDLGSIVHTAISAARDRANVKTYESFDDVIIGWKSIATLDSRVSAVCASLDGVTYMKPKFKKYEDIPNRPPRHPRCRSILRSLTKLDEEGLRPQNGDTKGQISSNTKFPDWFANQSKDFQRKWLGQSRYDLYKDGRLAIKDFVDIKSGRLFTLDEIKAEIGQNADMIKLRSDIYNYKREGYFNKDMLPKKPIEKILTQYGISKQDIDDIAGTKMFTVENAVVYQGNNRYFFGGKQNNSVYIDKDKIHASDIIHSHPIGLSFSKEDIEELLKYGGNSIVAFNDVYFYRFENKLKNYDTIFNTISDTISNVDEKLKKLIKSGTITQSQAKFAQPHMIWDEVSKKEEGFIYGSYEISQ